MSAFIMDEGHLAEIACALYHWQATSKGIDVTPGGNVIRPTLGEFARCLAIANVESVAHRYRMTLDDAVKDFGMADDLKAFSSRVQMLAQTRWQDRGSVDIPTVEALFRSFEYQSCEVPDWQGSRVERWCIVARGRIALARAALGQQEKTS